LQSTLAYFEEEQNRKGRELIFEMKKGESVSEITPLEKMLLDYLTGR